MQPALKYLWLVLGVLVLQSCNIPTEPALPSWDVRLQFPVSHTTFTMEKTLQGDSSGIHWADDSVAGGRLYYTDRQQFETIAFARQLEVDGITAGMHSEVGIINIGTVQPIETGINLVDWVGVEDGDSTVLPESEGDIEKGFPSMKEFESVTLSQGRLEVEITNELPVELWLRGFRILNAVSRTIVIEQPVNDPVILDPKSTSILSYDLGTTTVSDTLVYTGNIYTPGSGMERVYLPKDAGTRIVAYLSDLEITEATAPLPGQEPRTTTGIMSLTDSMRISEAVFESGKFRMAFDNELPVSLRADLRIPGVRRQDGRVFAESVYLEPNETNHVVEISTIAQWRIIPEGGLSNKLNYEVTVQTDSTEEAVTIQSSDGVTANIQLADLTFYEVAGKVKPKKVRIDNRAFGLALSEIKEKIGFDSFRIQDPDIIFRLRSTADIPVGLSGAIIASNGKQEKAMRLHDVLLSGDEKTTAVNLRDYGLTEMMNSFSESLPDTFRFSGDAEINPNYEVGSVSANDSIGGSIDIQIPLNLSIQGGVFRDTTDLDTSEFSGQDTDQLNRLTLTFEFLNSVPVSLGFSASLLGEDGQELLQLPSGSGESLTIPAPQVDEYGMVTETESGTQSVELAGEDIEQFFDASKLAMQIEFNTAGENNQPVVFHNTDSLSVTIYGEGSVRINPD